MAASAVGTHKVTISSESADEAERLRTSVHWSTAGALPLYAASTVVGVKEQSVRSLRDVVSHFSRSESLGLEADLAPPTK